MNRPKKTLIVGWDAAPWEYIRPLLDRGRLPVLRELMAAGAHGRLESTLPPVTPVAWSSFVTGKNPGKHGVFGWLWRRPGTWEFLPCSASQRVGTPWWSYLNQAGLRVGLVNIPLSYPPAPLDGFVVCDFGAPTEAPCSTYPASLQGELEARFGWRAGGGMGSGEPGCQDDGRLFAAELAQQEQHVHMALHLCGRFEVDVLAINLMLLDHCNHFARDPGLPAAALEICDRHTAELMRAFEPEDVLLFSDHGSRRVAGSFWLGPWLGDRGYLLWKRRTHMSADHLNWLLTCIFEQYLGWPKGLYRPVRAALRQALGRLPPAANRRLFERLLAGAPRLLEQARCELAPDAASPLHLGDSGEIFLSQAGRDEGGVIPAGQRDGIRDTLRDRLLEVQDPDSGERLFRAVCRPEQVYSGAMLSSAPDLVLDAWSSRWSLARRLSREARPRAQYFAPPDGWFGDHTREGIFVLSGASFRARPEPGSAGLPDLPATLLYACGIPLPADWDGRPLLDLFPLAYAQAHPICFQDGDPPNMLPPECAIPQKEAGQIQARLRALGYLD